MSEPKHVEATQKMRENVAAIADVVAGKKLWHIIEGESLDVMRAMPSGIIGALITDPPYSSGGFTRGDRTADTRTKYSQATDDKEFAHNFSGDNRDQRSFEYWCALWLSEALRITTPGAPVVQFTDWRQLASTFLSQQAGGWIVRGVFVWSKGDACRPQMGRFRSACEYAVWGSNGPMVSGKEAEAVGCLPGVIECGSPPTDERLHLTQKPLQLMETVVRIAQPGSIVLDPFAGSGSTGVACLRKGRRFVGIERDAHYAAVARERLEAEAQGLTVQAARAGQLPLFADPPPSEGEFK